MPDCFLESLIEVEVRQEVAVFEEQDLDLVLVDPALEPVAFPVLERVLVDVSGGTDDAADSVLVPRVDVPHALALPVELVLPRLELGHFAIGHLLDGLDDLPVLVEHLDRKRLELLPKLRLFRAGALRRLAEHLGDELVVCLEHDARTAGLAESLLAFLLHAFRAHVAFVQDRVLKYLIDGRALCLVDSQTAADEVLYRLRKLCGRIRVRALLDLCLNDQLWPGRERSLEVAYFVEEDAQRPDVRLRGGQFAAE